MNPDHATANVARFSSYADKYDTYRPRPPATLPSVLKQVVQVQRPHPSSSYVTVWGGYLAQEGTVLAVTSSEGELLPKL